MITPQSPARSPSLKLREEIAASASAWRTYLGITALLLLIVVLLAGGIIWYNSRKSSELMLAAADRQMVETGEKISDRIRLLYDPLYAIAGIASRVPDMQSVLRDDGHAVMPMLLRALHFYPQILQLYVGFENGDFFMVTHIVGEDRARLRGLLKAPEKAAFATRPSRPARTACVRSAGDFSMMTVSRSVCAPPRRRISTRASARGMGRRSAVTMWS
jgi:adenylate cyclase